METMTMAKALNEGMRRALTDNDKVLLMGEDIGKLGGVFRITEHLQRDFGNQRVIDSPLAESAIIGTGVGLSIRGYRPVLEMQFDAFTYTAYDQIVNQVAKLRYRSEGAVALPMVIRIPFGGGIGSPEHHSESPEAAFAQHAGLRVVAPSDSTSAYWGIQDAIASEDPVIFLEPKRRYWTKGPVDTGASEQNWNRAETLRTGHDITLVTFGPLVPTALEAADIAADEGVSVEVLDLRSINPLDFDAVEASVKRTGRLVVAHEAPMFLGVGAEIAAKITERAFYFLQAPVMRVGAFHAPYPPSRLEHHYLPDADRILDSIDRALEF